MGVFNRGFFRAYLRIVSIVVLITTFPVFTGFDTIASCLAWGAEPEPGAYEIASTEPLHSLAESLKYRPLDVFEWVRREVRYEAYAGTLKGAQGTLFSRAGNDLDKSLLLGALLGICNTEWRLVRGDVRLYAPDAMLWLGVSSPEQGVETLEKGGLDVETPAPDRVVLKDHFWVEVRADYFPLAGAAQDDVTTGPFAPSGSNPDPEESWIALDPSVTLYESPVPGAMSQVVGPRSTLLWEAVGQTAEPVEGGDGVKSLPAQTIATWAKEAGRALKEKLEGENLDVETFLASPGALLLPDRQGLPGNLPYEVMHVDATYEKNAQGEFAQLADLLDNRRRTVTVSIENDSGALCELERVAISRLATERLTVSFDGENAGLSSNHFNSASVDLTTAYPVKPQLRLGKGSFAESSDEGLPVALGSKLWLVVSEEGRGDETRIPIVAGGFYSLVGFGALSDEDCAEVCQDLANGCDSREELLAEYLSLAGRSMLALSERASRLGLASVGYQSVESDSRLVVGVEPTVLNQEMTSPTLVVHLVPGASAAGPTPRLSAPELTRREAALLTSLLEDVGVTASMERLAGNPERQSASRLMMICDGAEGVNRAFEKTSQYVDLAPYLPSQIPGLADPLRQKLFTADLALTDDDLFGASVVADGAGQAGWGYWTVSPVGARGQMVSPTQSPCTAWAPLEDEDMHPLDSLLGYQTQGGHQALRAQGIFWGLEAVSVGLSTGIGQAAASSLIRETIHGFAADGAPNPAALPTAAIALHGATDYFLSLRVEEVAIEPTLLNLVGSRDLSVQATLSAGSDDVLFELMDTMGDVLTTDSVQTFGKTDLDTVFSIPAPAYLPGSEELADGVYALSLQARAAPDRASERLAASFEVDHTPPEAVLEPNSETITGKFDIRGRVTDAHLTSYTLGWSTNGTEPWYALPVEGASPVPFMSSLARVDSTAQRWNGTRYFQLAAADGAGNATSTTLSVTFSNDPDDPVVNVSEKNSDGVLEGMHETLTLNVSDPNGDDQSSGLARVRMWLESELSPPPDKDPFVLVDTSDFTSADTQFDFSKDLNTYKLDLVYPGETWKLVAEATDKAGHTGRDEITSLTVANLVWKFSVKPKVFPVGTGTTFYSECTESSIDWTLTLQRQNPNAALLPVGSRFAPVWDTGGSGVLPSTIAWDGNESNGAVAPAGLYRATLAYEKGAQSGSAEEWFCITDGEPNWTPSIVHFKALDQNGDTALDDNGDPILDQEVTPANIDTALILNSDTPKLKITAQLSEQMRPFLDGACAGPDSCSPPYKYGFWTIDYKSSFAPPSAEDLRAAVGSKEEAGLLADRSTWRNLAWGNTYPTNGLTDGILNVSSLGPGFYDVRVWCTDGMAPRGMDATAAALGDPSVGGPTMAQHVIFYITVDRNTSDDGGEIGEMSLSATDMTVPMAGFNAQVSRSYSSTDVYAPGPLGYGWRLHNIAMNIEHLSPELDTTERDEATITLPDGRKFFFGNNPCEKDLGSQEYSLWTKRGEYTNRPYGMRLLRPGGSKTYHAPWDNVQTLLKQADMDGNDDFSFSPGDPDRYMQIVYTPSDGGEPYEAGEVAYLQTEDKTWHVFKWKTGELLEIVHPDGQTTAFKRGGGGYNVANILVTDNQGRTVSIVRDPVTRRISRIVDPNGNGVAYEYDKYDNLETVTDRSGRKRFYIYDTPEARDLFPGDEKFTGHNLHYLVDVRVDDDSDGVEHFAGDTIPPTDEDRFSGSNPAYQNYPGDTSVLEMTYENGMLKRIGTEAGGAELDHNLADNQEVVRDENTQAETIVTYDDSRRVTEKQDAWGQTTAYDYWTGNDATIEGALKEETDALGNVTEYDYVAPTTDYPSFTAIFTAYVTNKLGGDLEVPGYLTGSQGGPTEIVQLPGTPLETTTKIGYANLNSGNAAAFQPTSIDAPGNNSTSMEYDDSTRRLKKVESSTGATVENEYYGSGQNDLVYGGAVPEASIGRLKKTISKAADGATPRTTEYGYKYEFVGDTLTTETHAVRDPDTG
ncbi:RHS repeat protein, partial [Candidatus Sumerlaeota bacterium]|nr:RHS repeat protein [Candidatus Sumerlaeota bacterium]